MPVGVALYGANGHQIVRQLVDHPRARLVATAAIPLPQLGDHQQRDPQLKVADTLDELLADDRVQLVSLCSPRRRQQAADAIRCLEAGRHVYAEKPCALTEGELNDLQQVARDTGGVFHEMAGSAFMQPYLAMRNIVQSGQLGTIVHVLAQKSYPMHANRPQDEDIDGGLTCQVGVHAFRFIEHVTGIRIAAVDAFETKLGSPRADGELRVASACMLRLENGGVGAVVNNYLNQPGFGSWGNETLRIWGTDGFVEATDGGRRTHLVLGDHDAGELDVSAPGFDWFELMLDEIIDGDSFPVDLETELHPTRMVIRARAAAHQHRVETST